MAKAEYKGVNGIARKVKSQNLGAWGGVARKVSKGFVGVNGVARQFFAATPTWKKYKTNVAYTLGCDVTTDDVAEQCHGDWEGLTCSITPVYGSWPYVLTIVTGKGDPASYVTLNQNTGKIHWNEIGNFKQYSSSGTSSYRLSRLESDRWNEQDCVLFFHTYGPTGSSKYMEEHYQAYAYYHNDEATYKTYQINLAWACIYPNEEMSDIWATVLYYQSPKATLYHFYPKASYSRGDYIEEVTSESEGAYPANGRHTDGYWYVRQ